MIRALSARSFIAAAAFLLAPFVLQGQATATTCADGTTSSAIGKGACSGHGGVAKKAAKDSRKTSAKADTKAARADAKSEMKADSKAAKADERVAKAADKVAAKSATSDVKQTGKSATDAAGATAKCKDGTYSHAASRQGACSRHGGVAEWLKS